MMPTIRPGAWVEIRSATLDRMARGDIALLKTPSGLRLHRVVEIHADLLITRGDNHEHNDAPAEAHDVLGRLHAVSQPRHRWARLLRRLR